MLGRLGGKKGTAAKWLTLLALILYCLAERSAHLPELAGLCDSAIPETAEHMRLESTTMASTIQNTSDPTKVWTTISEVLSKTTTLPARERAQAVNKAVAEAGFEGLVQAQVGYNGALQFEAFLTPLKQK